MKLSIYLFLLSFLIISCDDPSSSSSNGETIPEYARITFKNDTQFYVKVYRDSSILLFDELAPGESKSSNIRESTEGHIGTTFHYEYRFKLSDLDDQFSGDAFANGTVTDLDETIPMQIGDEVSRNIPVPQDIIFYNAYIRVKNNAAFNVFLRGAPLQLGNSQQLIPSGETGIYRIGSLDLNSSYYALQNMETPYNLPSMLFSLGYVYDFIFTEEGNSPHVIANTKWKIKPEPTTTWKKEVTKYNVSNFSNAALNSHLVSIARRLSISNWRSNYPVNKILYSDGCLINGEGSFGVIPAIIQNTGVAAPYEIPLIAVKDAEWESFIVPGRNLYAGTASVAYNTSFNDIIKSGSNYIVLTTYTKGLRTGLWLFFLNEQGQTVDSWNIEPNNNTEGLIGTKLVRLADNSFLVLGSKNEYTNSTDEHFTTSKSFIYKYQMGNSTKQWGKEYSHPSHYANTAICGLELADSIIICGTAGDNTSTKTTILKIHKNDGNIIDVQSIGTASDSWRPFSVGSDNAGYVYISGIATEGAGSKAYILKLNSTYSRVWLNKYGNKVDNFLFDLNITDNLLTAVGSSNDGAVFDPSFYGWQGGKGWIFRIDTENGIVIKEIFDDTVSSYNSIARLNDGGFALAAIKSIDNVQPYWFNTFAVKLNEHLIRGKL